VEIWILPNVYEYLVQPGDSLMGIAQKELGAEGRYLEIISLNKKLYPTLETTTVIGVGMKLRLPKD
jgi:nucleoid-associated protein YgaU